MSYDPPATVLEIATMGPQGPIGPAGPELIPTTPIADADPLVVDISTGQTFEIPLLGDRTINLTGGTSTLAGKKIVLRLKQDGTGGRTVTWGATVRFGADLPLVTLSTTPEKTDIIGFIYDHTTAKFDLVAFAKGY